MLSVEKENTGIAPGNSELIIDTTCVTSGRCIPWSGLSHRCGRKMAFGTGTCRGTNFNGSSKPNTQSIGFDYEFIIPTYGRRVPCVFVENGRVGRSGSSDPITVSYDHQGGRLAYGWRKSGTGETETEVRDITIPLSTEYLVSDGWREVKVAFVEWWGNYRCHHRKSKKLYLFVSINLSSYIWVCRMYMCRAFLIPRFAGKVVSVPVVM